MKSIVQSVSQTLNNARERQFIPVMDTESLEIACQKFNGNHDFKHLNRKHDEVIYVISGELQVWTREGDYSLKAGDLIKIPKDMEHGDLVALNAEILIIEGKL